MKSRRAKILLGLAVLSGLATASVARNVLERSKTPIETAAVLTATERLAPGQTVSAAATRKNRWPAGLVPEGALRSDAELQGRVLARPVEPGEPILKSAFLPEGKEAGLDAVIGEGHRAVSVKVDEFVGVAGFLQPGSHVDVIATATTRSGSGENARSDRQTSTLLENLRVLAVDERLVRNEGGPDEEIKVVTLEVDANQAAALTHAEHEGRVKLALRSQGGDAEPTNPVTMVLGTSVHEVRF